MTRTLVPTAGFVHILIEDRGRYVLIQEAKPELGCPWCYPAGGMEPGESIVEAVVREALEECGEVAAEVNHLEGSGVKVLKLDAPDRSKLAKELSHVIGAVLHLAIHYGLQAELEASVDDMYRHVVSEGLVAPLDHE